jgi:hypothetical protein
MWRLLVIYEGKMVLVSVKHSHRLKGTTFSFHIVLDLNQGAKICNCCSNCIDENASHTDSNGFLHA